MHGPTLVKFWDASTISAKDGASCISRTRYVDPVAAAPAGAAARYRQWRNCASFNLQLATSSMVVPFARNLAIAAARGAYGAASVCLVLLDPIRAHPNLLVFRRSKIRKCTAPQHAGGGIPPDHQTIN